MLEKWLLIIIMGAAFGSACFVAGALYTEKETAQKEVKVLIKKVEVIKYVAVGQNKIAEAYERGRADRQAELDKLRRELSDALDQMGPAAKAVCLSNGVVGVLNRGRATGRSAADPGKPDAAVPPAKPAG